MIKFDLQPTLRSQLLELRPLRADDFSQLYLAASDPSIWRGHPASDRYQEKVFKEFFAKALASGGAFAVLDLKTQKIIGSTRYYELDPNFVVIGFTFLQCAYWGGVYNSDMKKLLLDHAFQFVSEVHFHVDETNVRSKRAMEKVGGQIIGSFKKKTSNGTERTTLVYAIVQSKSKA